MDDLFFKGPAAWNARTVELVSERIFSMLDQRVSRVLAVMVLLGAFVTVFPIGVEAQSMSAGTVSGTVTDPNGAVVPNANVTIANSITGYKNRRQRELMAYFNSRTSRQITIKLRFLRMGSANRHRT